MHFFINTWTWSYEDVLKAIAHAFHCKLLNSLPPVITHRNFSYILGSKHPTRPFRLNCPLRFTNRYKHNVQFIHVVQTLSCVRTREAAPTRFHAWFDRCSFVDVSPYDYGTKGTVALPSNKGKKVV